MVVHIFIFFVCCRGRPNDRRRMRNQNRPVGIEYLLNEFLSGMSRTATQNMDTNGPL